jgi:hypothetical protein
VQGFLQTWWLAFRTKSSILVSSVQRIFFLMVWESFWQTPNGQTPFTVAWLPSGHSTIKAWLVDCCKDGCRSGRFSHFNRGTLELCQSDHRVLGHLPDQGPSPLIVQFGRAASSRKSLGSSTFLGDLQCCRNVLVTLPLPWLNPVSELYGQFLQPHGLVLALTCTVKCDLI